MESFSLLFGKLISDVVIFFILTLLGRYVYSKVINSSNRLFNPREFLPDDEIHTLKQIFFLIMMGASCFIILYSVVAFTDDLMAFCIVDIFFSLIIAIRLDLSSLKNKLLLILLIPYGSLTFALFGLSLVSLIEIIHIPVFIYFAKIYYDKFREYTENNGLGITITLLFIIVFVSFLITQVVEGVNPVDAIVMVSNAFTSNGYAVLGKTIPGKINSVFLVWGGYILSGVGTATLTVAIVMKHVNARFDELKELIEETKKDENEDK